MHRYRTHLAVHLQLHRYLPALRQPHRVHLAADLRHGQRRVPPRPKAHHLQRKSEAAGHDQGSGLEQQEWVAAEAVGGATAAAPAAAPDLPGCAIAPFLPRHCPQARLNQAVVKDGFVLELLAPQHGLVAQSHNVTPAAVALQRGPGTTCRRRGRW